MHILSFKCKLDAIAADANASQMRCNSISPRDLLMQKSVACGNPAIEMLSLWKYIFFTTTSSQIAVNSKGKMDCLSSMWNIHDDATSLHSTEKKISAHYLAKNFRAKKKFMLLQRYFMIN